SGQSLPQVRAGQDMSLQGYGELKEVDGHHLRFLVRREALTQTVARILAELEVIDLSVTDPPIEEVIGRVFQAGVVE
ncbi:MAG: ABC transporter, partial [Moorea sp. SIO3C2]|nr:ABC transporter [Moorena sp. SIO3C2]